MFLVYLFGWMESDIRVQEQDLWDCHEQWYS